MEAPPAGERKDRLGDHAAGFADSVERRFEIVDADYRQRRGQRIRRPCSPTSVVPLVVAA